MKHLKSFEDVFLYEDDFHILDLDELWRGYLDNFEEIQHRKIRNKSKDLKTILF